LDVIASILNEIDGGKVLDVGTQEGHFVQVLKNNLSSYTEIVGIDIDRDGIETAKHTLDNDHIQFLTMDAEKLAFENESFETVTISACLHHLANIPQVLHEMKRVLKPEGHFIIIEMHESGKTETELTSVYLHQWVAEVDTTLGHLHNRTLARDEIVSYATALELCHVEAYDYRDTDTKPFETTTIEQLEKLIERTTQRAKRTSNHLKLMHRGSELQRRLHEVGVTKEPIIILVGNK